MPDDDLSPIEREMIAGLEEFCAALEAGVPLESRFRVTEVRIIRRPGRAPIVTRVVRGPGTDVRRVVGPDDEEGGDG